MKALPALQRPPEDPALSLIGEQLDDGRWRYECAAMCGAACVLAFRWKHRGNKHNGWGVYRWPGRKTVAAFCPECAVAETRDRARSEAGR